MTYSHLWADCLYTGISSRPSARQRVWEAFTVFRSTRLSRANKVGLKCPSVRPFVVHKKFLRFQWLTFELERLCMWVMTTARLGLKFKIIGQGQCKKCVCYICRYVGRGWRVMHDGMQYDPIQGQGHEFLKVGNSAIFKGYLLPHL